MPFQPGQSGSKPGKRSKRVFSAPDIVNSMFKNQIPELATRRTSVAAAIHCTGKNLYLDYLKGTKTLTARQSIVANCFDCCGNYVDGRHDCENPICPCYPFMPYRQKDKK
jgi:hypothetical protein